VPTAGRAWLHESAAALVPVMHALGSVSGREGKGWNGLGRCACRRGRGTVVAATGTIERRREGSRETEGS
jgi:hypothetical protein